MTKTPDDLEAVRTVVSALSGFSPEEQERIIRWAREKLGLSTAPRDLAEGVKALSPLPVAPSSSGESATQAQAPTATKDLKTFVTSKNPRSDVQFAATVAYFYRFESPLEQRREAIDAAILQDACRLAGRARLSRPGMTLTNAKNQGLLDKGSETGEYAINTIGENLVVMTLPGHSDGAAARKRSRKATQKTGRKKK